MKVPVLEGTYSNAFIWLLRNFLHISLVVTTLACNDKKQITEKVSIIKNKNHFSNIIQVKQFGDSIRLEIERKGDTLIKHYIDLNGTKGDNFDDSYNAICIYKKRLIDSTALVKGKKVRLKATLMENYTTEFSGGRNYYLITVDGDTILNGHINDYMR